MNQYVFTYCCLLEKQTHAQMIKVKADIYFLTAMPVCHIFPYAPHEIVPLVGGLNSFQR